MASADEPDTATKTIPPSAGGRLCGRNVAEGVTPVLPALVIAAVGGGVFLWRTLAWQPAVRVDGWAYAAWGQALVRGEHPLFELGSTTPKPLAALLGALVVPLPPDRAFAVVAALALGVVAAIVFAGAHREGRAIAAVIAVVALVVGARLNLVLAFGYIDAVVAALLLAGLVVRGRLRVTAFVLAGLLRPEAWLLAAVAGFSETGGSLRRRAGGALVAGVAAPVLWIVSDVVLVRDPLGTLHWQSERHSEKTVENVPWIDVPGQFWTALTKDASALLVLVGLLGLCLHYLKTRRGGSADPMPLVVVVVWSLLLALEARYGVELNSRYLLPVLPILALGCGLLAAVLLPGRTWMRSPWPAVAVASGVLVLVTISMGIGPGVPRQIARNAAITATRPAVESVLFCGRLGVIRRRTTRDLIPQLAASSRRSLYEFGIYRGGSSFAAVLDFAPRRRSGGGALPSWPRHTTPLGPLAVAPGCPAFE